MPQAVLLPSSTAEVQAILRLCHRERIPFVARGSATSPQRRYSRFFATSIN
jgi:FAD/FMN-containing dehydrogenase